MCSRFVAVVFLTILTAPALAERLAVAGTTGVTILDTATGKSVASVAVPGGATKILSTRDGSRLIAISRGPGATSWLGNFKPKEKASVAVIDGASMKVLAQNQLGWDATDAQLTADEKHVVILSPGAGAKPFSSAHVIDVATGAVAGKIDFLPRRASGSLVLGSNQAVVYFEGNKEVPTLLQFFDLPSLTKSSELTIKGKTVAPAAFENHDFIYLLEASGFRAATLNIVSASERKIVATPEVGQIASIAAYEQETGRLYVLSQSTERGKRNFNGRLDIFRDGKIEHALKTVDIPKTMTFTPDRKRAFIHSTVDTSIIDLATLEQTEKPIRYFASPHSGYFTPDQKRAVFYFATDEACCGAMVFNMETGEVMKHLRLGGIGIRIAEALLAVGATAASFADAQTTAKRTGASSFYYSVYTPRASTVGRGPLVVGADGKFAYGVDSKSNRVTTIDLTIGDRLKTDIDIPNGAREMVALKNGGVLAVMGEKGLTFIDPVARTVIAEHKFPGELRRVEVSEDGERAIAVADGRIAVFDTAGKVLAENTTVAEPSDWIVMK